MSDLPGSSISSLLTTNGLNRYGLFHLNMMQAYVFSRVCGIIAAFCAPMAQRIEHRTSNPTVAGSSPAGRARVFKPETRCVVSGFFFRL